MNLRLIPKAALALVRAGYLSLEDLRGASREQLCAIPGVGPGSLKPLEEALGTPLAREGKARKPPPPAVPWPEHLWRKRGLPSEAAITFAQQGITVESLKAMNRDELLELRGVGSESLRACERIIGQAFPDREPAEPGMAWWFRRGLARRAARALRDAGFETLDDLHDVTREDLLALRGIGESSIVRLEGLLGRTIPVQGAGWLERGLSARAAHALDRAGIRTLADFGRMTRDELLSLRGIGFFTLRQCERLLGRTLPFCRRDSPAQ